MHPDQDFARARLRHSDILAILEDFRSAVAVEDDCAHGNLRCLDLVAGEWVG